MTMTLQDVQAVLARVTFADSCVDMGWRWEVIGAYSPEAEEMKTSLRRHGIEPQPVPIGFLIRTTFRRPDRDTKRIETGYGRWWHVPADVTESGIAKTAFAAAKLILEHELMESFRVDGVRIFDPHHSLADLRAAAAHASSVRGGDLG